MERLLTEQEAASLYGLSPAWFQKKRWQGGGPRFVRVGRAIRYREQDLRDFLEAQPSRVSTSDSR